MKYAIAHASWAPGRSATLARLVKQLAEQGADIHVSVSARREHAAVWATRLWEYAAFAEEPTVCLNDDLIISDDFVATCEAISEAVPNEVVSLHTQVPGIEEVSGPWARCYWLTGPAYLLPAPNGVPCAAREMLDYPMPWELLSRINEDNRAIHWAWENQRPFYSVTVAPCIHDVGTSSTLGYDGHPHRLPKVTWRDRPGADLTSPEYWKPDGDPPLLANPWMPPEYMAMVRDALKNGRTVCLMCSGRIGIVGTKLGQMICGSCAQSCWNTIQRRIVG